MPVFLADAHDVLALRRLVATAQHVVALLAKLVVVRRQMHLLLMRRARAQPTRGRCPCPARRRPSSAALEPFETIRCSALAGRIAAAIDASRFQLVRAPPQLRVCRAGRRRGSCRAPGSQGRPSRSSSRSTNPAMLSRKGDRGRRSPLREPSSCGTPPRRGPAVSPTWRRQISPPWR
jgi:hypothetical protein